MARSIKYPDKKSIIAEVQRRAEAGFPVDATSLARGIKKHRDSRLYNWGVDYFGDWESVIEAAGFSYEEVRRKWSRCYPDQNSIIVEIQRRAEMGVPLNGLAVAKGEHRDQMLYTYGRKYFGNWKSAVEAAGIDFRQVSLLPSYRLPDKHSVVREIQRRHEMGLPIDFYGIFQGEHGDRALYKKGLDYFGGWHATVEAAGFKSKKGKEYLDVDSVVGEICRRKQAGLLITFKACCSGTSRDRALMQAAITCFGSWENAVKAAGFNNRTCLSWDTDSIIRGIQRRERDGLPINSNALQNGDFKDTILISAPTRLFGSWRASVEAAGFDYDAIRKSPAGKYREPDAVVEEIQRREGDGVPINSTAITQGRFSDHPLMVNGSKYFGSWKRAVEAAGFDYGRVCRFAARKYPDADSVVVEIQRRAETGEPLNGRAVAKGEKYCDQMLHKYGIKYFGSWKDALGAAGISYEEVRLKPQRRYPDKASIVEEIQGRTRAGRPLNGLAVAKGKHRDPRLHKCGQEYFGSWKAALEAAGISYEEVRKKRKYPDKASVIEGIRCRIKAGLPLNGFTMTKGEHRDSLLYDCGREHFSSWKVAIEECGLEDSK